MNLLIASSLALSAAALPSRGPYIQQSNENSSYIVWRTEADSSGKVYYGEDGLTQSADSSAAGKQHEVKLSGLKAGTKYVYCIDGMPNCKVGGTPAYSFTTSPKVGEKQPVRFWAVGDSGTASGIQALVRDQMLKRTKYRKPDLFLHVGDMAYGSGTFSEFQIKFFGMYANILAHTPVWPAIGNHEGKTSDSVSTEGPYYQGYVLPKGGESGGLASGTEAYYSFDYANIHFIALESQLEEMRAEDGAMLKWLQMDLAATNQDWIVAFFHHPPYTKGSHDSDVETAHIQMRERALPILEAAGVDLVIGGHSHIYERSYLCYGAHETPTVAGNSIRDNKDGKLAGAGAYIKNADEDGGLHVVAGHGGTPTRQDSPTDHPLMYFTEIENGSVVVDIQGDVLRLENIRHDGEITDSVTVLKKNGLVATISSDEFVAGQKVDIHYQSNISGQKLSLEYQVEGGSWQTIATDLAEKGSYSWTLPDTQEKPLQVRLSTADGKYRYQVPGNFPVLSNPFKEVFAADAPWKFHFAETNKDWTAPEFVDVEWGEGKGSFAVCGCVPWQCGCGTYIADALLVPTVYFRKSFTIDSLPQEYELNMLYESGATIWLNGKQIYQGHLKEGMAFDERALPSSIGAVQESIRGSGADLKVGKNVLAVVVKKGHGIRPNLRFEASLRTRGNFQEASSSDCSCATASSRDHGFLALSLIVPLLVTRRRRKVTKDADI